MPEIFNCPECGSLEVTVAHEQVFMVNSGDHYCHRIKTHDAESRSTCLECEWVGTRDDLVLHKEPKDA